MNSVKDFSNRYLAERLRQGKQEPGDALREARQLGVIATRQQAKDWWIDRIAALIAIVLLCTIGYIAYHVLQTEITPYPSVEGRP